MIWWQNALQKLEPTVQLLDSWRTMLPVRITALQASMLVMGVFLAIALAIMLAGRILVGWGRNKLPEADQIGSRRPLVLGPLTMAFAWVFPVSQAKQEQLRNDLVAAGYFHRHALEEYLSFRNAAALAWLVFTGTAVVLLAEPGENLTTQILVSGAVVFGFLLAVPRIVLSGQAEARRNRIRFALPDALDMICMMVTGGLPLRQAVQRVQKDLFKAHPDMACELAIISHHAEAGSMDQSLQQFAARVKIPDVTVLATMVRHAEKLGGNITGAFREFADSIRRTRRQLAEERGNKASVKLMFPTILCLTPPVYILLLGPAVIEIKNFIQRENRQGGVLTQAIDPRLNSASGQSSESTGDAKSR